MMENSSMSPSVSKCRWIVTYDCVEKWDCFCCYNSGSKVCHAFVANCRPENWLSFWKPLHHLENGQFIPKFVTVCSQVTCKVVTCVLGDCENTMSCPKPSNILVPEIKVGLTY